MKLELEIKEEAREDITDIFLWYEEHQIHLGYRFLDAPEERISFLQKRAPGLFKEIQNF